MKGKLHKRFWVWMWHSYKCMNVKTHKGCCVTPDGNLSDCRKCRWGSDDKRMHKYEHGD